MTGLDMLIWHTRDTIMQSVLILLNSCGYPRSRPANGGSVV